MEAEAMDGAQELEARVGEEDLSDAPALMDRRRCVELLGGRATGALMQACVACNRLMSAFDLLSSSQRAPGFLQDRNRKALMALVLMALEDGAAAILMMKDQGVSKKLGQGAEYFAKLVVLAGRWRDKRGPYKQLRNTIVHPSSEKMLKALTDLEGEFVFSRTTDGRALNTIYEGPDLLPWISWGGEVPGHKGRGGAPRERTPAEVQNVLSAMEADSYRFGALFDAVVTDLMGALHDGADLTGLDRALQRCDALEAGDDAAWAKDPASRR